MDDADSINFPNYDEFVLQVKTPLGWSAIGGYNSKEELLAVLDQIRSSEIPFNRKTFRFFKISHKAGSVTYSHGNTDPLASNPDRNYPTNYKMPDFHYRGDWEY